MRFAGKTVVITGAASGIGLASVHKFAAEGAYVVAADIDAAAGAITATPERVQSHRKNDIKTTAQKPQNWQYAGGTYEAALDI